MMVSSCRGLLGKQWVWLLFLLLASASRVAHGAVIVDPTGDFLPTYVGSLGGDLDVVSAEVVLRADGTLRFKGELAANVGTTPGAFYVWGLDRGAGTPRFTAGSPSIGAGVNFDSVLVARQDGTANFVDLIGGVNTALPVGAVVITDNRISVSMALALAPTRGFALGQYRFNLWPRDPGAGNTHLSDFAPDAATERVTALPEPTSILAFGLPALALLVKLRRRRAPG